MLVVVRIVTLVLDSHSRCSLGLAYVVVGDRVVEVAYIRLGGFGHVVVAVLALMLGLLGEAEVLHRLKGTVGRNHLVKHIPESAVHW